MNCRERLFCSTCTYYGMWCANVCVGLGRVTSTLRRSVLVHTRAEPFSINPINGSDVILGNI